jgi:hypothetical protein
LELVHKYGKRWKKISYELNEEFIGKDFTPTSVRSVYDRNFESRYIKIGEKRNKCGVCGQLKRGHICTGRQQVQITTE